MLGVTSSKRVDRLKTEFARTLEQAQSEPHFGLPAWADDAFLAQARATPLVICGTGHWAVAFLAVARGLVEIVALVDDRLAGQTVEGVPCIDTPGLIELARRRP